MMIMVGSKMSKTGYELDDSNDNDDHNNHDNNGKFDDDHTGYAAQILISQALNLKIILMKKDFDMHIQPAIELLLYVI